MKNLTTTIVILFSVATATAIAAKTPAEKIPADVQSHAETVKECRFWQNEDVWVSKTRANEIRTALNKLDCDALEKKEQAIRTKYKNNKTFVQAIEDAKKSFTKQ